MFKSFLLTFLTQVTCSIGIAQSYYTDSLRLELAKAENDTSRVLILTDLSYYHRYQNLDSAMIYGQQALSLAQRTGFLRGEAIAYSVIGAQFRLRGDLSKSLEMHFRSLKIAEENNYKQEIAYCFIRIGLVYLDLGDYKKAVSLHRQSLQILGETERSRIKAITYLQLGFDYTQMDQLDSAWYFGLKAYENLDLIKDLTSDACRTLGIIQLKKGNRSLGVSYFKESIDAALKLKDYRAISLTYAELAGMYRREKQLDSSIYFAENGLEYAQTTNSRRSILSCGNFLAEIYDSINPAKALRYFRIAAAAKDSLFGAGNLKTIQTLVSKEEARQKEIELAREAYQTQLKQYALTGSLGVFLVIALILYRNNLNRKKANQLLQYQKSEVEIQKKNVELALADLKSTQSQLIQSEKMASLGELTAGIAHEIQNPLNFVNNFSEVNRELLAELNEEIEKENFKEVKTIAADIIENEEKISHHGKRADSIVKGMLQHSRNNSGEKEPTDINALAEEYLRLAYQGLRAKDKTFNTQFSTSFDPAIGTVNIVPQDIGRVLLNLYNNAFYAVSGRDKRSVVSTTDDYQPQVSVTTKKKGNHIEITVKDNGNGIPQKVLDKIFQPFFTTKPTGQGTGLGLSLAYDIVKAHGGELNVQTKEGEGSEFIIQMPA